MKERSGVDLGGSGSGEELGEAGGKGTVVRIYCIKTIFDKNIIFILYMWYMHAYLCACMCMSTLAHIEARGQQ